MKPRPEVKRFAQEMERQLTENDHKGGWKKCDYLYLMSRLKEETGELHRAIQARFLVNIHAEKLITKEAADVANFAMMIADVYGNLMGKEE